MRLRVKDVPFGLNQNMVRDGKRGKHRIILLPEAVKAPLQRHLAKVKALHERDMKDGFGEVLPAISLEKKYRNASREWGWQYVFPGSIHTSRLKSRLHPKVLKNRLSLGG